MENLVVDESARGQGVAKAIIDWVRDYGKRQKCNVVLADTYLQNTPIQSLFFKEGFFIRGFHFYHTLDGKNNPPKAAIISKTRPSRTKAKKKK